MNETGLLASDPATSFAMGSRPETKVAVVSGGSRGLGAVIVRRLLRDGWSVATFSRTEPPSFDLDPRIIAERLHWERVDMGSTSALRSFVTGVVARFGAVDLLINNAGMLAEGLLATTSDRTVEEVIAVNLVGPILLTRACVKTMMPRRRGTVINVSSINSVRGHQGVAVYTASKAGLDGFTRSMARELGPLDIRVNSVVPGFFASDLVSYLSPTRRDRIARRTPLARTSDVEQVADAVMFLTSESSSFITGQTIVVDGGYTC